MAKILPARTTSERLKYGFDWSPELAQGETLLRPSVETVVGDTVVTDVDIDGGVVTFRLEGGTAEKTLHYLSVQADTSLDQHLEALLQIHVIAGHTIEDPPVDPDAPSLNFSDPDNSQYLTLIAA